MLKINPKLLVLQQFIQPQNKVKACKTGKNDQNQSISMILII